MVNCNSIQSNVSKICAADFNKRIKVQTSSISGSNEPNGKAVIGFVTVATVWAKIKTVSSVRSSVSGVGVQNVISTDFYIRYNSAIDLGNPLWVEYDNKRFKIITPENIDKDNVTILLRSQELGDKTIPANER
jgi:head-tail adaptor